MKKEHTKVLPLKLKYKICLNCQFENPIQMFTGRIANVLRNMKLTTVSDEIYHYSLGQSALVPCWLSLALVFLFVVLKLCSALELHAA